MNATPYPPRPVREPEPMGSAALETRLLRAVINQVDYGLAVIDTDSRQLLFANAPALAALQPDGNHGTGLQVDAQRRVHARRLGDETPFALALQHTKTGQRSLFRLPDRGATGSPEVATGTVAVLPLSTPGYALLAFAKQALCDTATVTLFARNNGLTSAEGQVLAGLCEGLRPNQIANRQGVKESTVRTQLRSIRAKTATESIQDLVQRVILLPPMAARLSQLAF